MTFEIYFNDLNPEAQHNLLASFHTTEEEENWKDIPLATIEREDESVEKDEIVNYWEGFSTLFK
jgi:hypothetical protein